MIPIPSQRPERLAPPGIPKPGQMGQIQEPSFFRVLLTIIRFQFGLKLSGNQQRILFQSGLPLPWINFHRKPAQKMLDLEEEPKAEFPESTVTPA